MADRTVPVADYIYERLPTTARAAMLDWMEAIARDEDEMTAEYCNLSNAGECIPIGPPFGDREIAEMLRGLARARTGPLTDAIDWECLLEDAFGREEAAAVGTLFEEASGLKDSMVFADPRSRRHHGEVDVDGMQLPDEVMPSSEGDRLSATILEFRPAKS